MIRTIHRLLSSNSVTGKLQRSVVSRIKRTLGVPDPWSDIRALIAQTSPEAVLDIGSHVGATIARILESSKLPIHGFEPTRESFEKLNRRFAGQPLVSIHNIALSDRTGEAIFHCNANEQTNSLLDNVEGYDNALSEHTRHLGTQTVRTMRLDDWMVENLPSQKVVIKSDVQGAEGLLLDGGRRTFQNQVIGFYSEAQIAPIYKGQLDFCSMHKRLVEELGFVLHNIYPCYHDQSGRALQTDALWIKESYLETKSG